MTVISVENVSKSFALKNGNRIVALNNISLDVKEGDSLAIVGPSGCGKTTLLRIIAGLEAPDTGEVWYDDELLFNTDRKERGIGMVFQDYALIPHWETRKTIGFFLRLRRREQEVPETVERVSKITGVGIDHLMDKFPKQLSGGEKQRVAIARAFARDLKLLLFDEPFANLDAKFRNTARLEARKLLNEFRVTTLYVTHDQIEAATMAEKIIVMREGRIEQIGPYQHIYYDPETIFAAQFIGVPTMNMFAGQVVGGVWRGKIAGQYPINNPDVADGTPVMLGIRPENVSVGDENAGRVVRITPHLAEHYQILTIQSNAMEWSVQVPLEDTFDRGETYHFQFDTENIYFFHAETGRRIRPKI